MRLEISHKYRCSTIVKLTRLSYASNTSRVAVGRSAMLPQRRLYSMVVDNQRHGLLLKNADSKKDNGKLLYVWQLLCTGQLRTDNVAQV